MEVTLYNSSLSKLWYLEDLKNLLKIPRLWPRVFGQKWKLSCLIPCTAVQSFTQRLFSRQSLWSGKLYLDQTSLIHRDPPDSASSVLGLKASSQHACLDWSFLWVLRYIALELRFAHLQSSNLMLPLERH